MTLQANNRNTILILGDSLSASHGIEAHLGWPTLLQARLTQHHYDFDIANISISGETTSNGLLRLPAALHELKPRITILELGANDGLNGLAIASIEKNLQTMIDEIKQVNSKVLLLGLRIPPDHGVAYMSQFQQMFINLAIKNNIQLVPLFLNAVDLDPSLMQEDGLHPNEKAQATLLENIWKGLKPLLDQA